MLNSLLKRASFRWSKPPLAWIRRIRIIGSSIPGDEVVAPKSHCALTAFMHFAAAQQDGGQDQDEEHSFESPHGHHRYII